MASRAVVAAVSQLWSFALLRRQIGPVLGAGGFTIDGMWTSARLAQVGLITNSNSTGISYAPNVHYKFELGHEWFIEPVVGVTYTQAFDANFGTQTGDSTEVHGGARFGTETT
jgi:hypothetical protein